MFLTAFAFHFALAAAPATAEAEPASDNIARHGIASTPACPSARPPVRRPPMPPRSRRHLRLGPGGLRAHEDRYGHCCRKHVGRTPEQMFARLRREKKLIHVSTFRDMETAQKVLRETLNQKAQRLARWEVAGNAGSIEIYGRFNYPIGTYVVRSSPRVHEAYRSYFLLVGNKFWPGGFQIITGYPVP